MPLLSQSLLCMSPEPEATVNRLFNVFLIWNAKPGSGAGLPCALLGPPFHPGLENLPVV